MLARRKVVAGIASLLAAPACVRLPVPTDFDAIIVGAGVAGLSAAHALTTKGRRILVLEARSRIGGRAWTDANSLGVPFDQGAHWLHNAEHNSFTQLAKDRGLALKVADISDRQLYCAGKALSDENATLRMNKATSDLERRMFIPSILPGDSSLAPFLSGDEWRDAMIGIAAFSLGAQPDRISFGDFLSLEDGEERTVSGGYGALVAAVFKSVPVRLDHRVALVDWHHGNRIAVSGQWGSATARHVIIAVPPTVLASGGIRFSPDLPQAKAEALGKFTVGQFLKVGFRFEGMGNRLPEYHADICRLASGNLEMLVADQFDPVLTLIASGDLASELARQDIAGRRAYAIERITQTLGKNAAGRLGAVISYDWAADPLSLGSFSAVRPGAGNARRKFAQPLQGRVHFAGDAAPGPFATTVYGAHLSGLRAARQTERELAR